MRQKNSMTKYIIAVFLFTNYILSAQISGKVVDNKNKPLPYVSVYSENSLTGTITNGDGLYELEIIKKGNYTVVFQFIGYKSVRKKVAVNTFPFVLNVTLQEEEIVLDEVQVSSEGNIAKKIIRNVIKNKDKNTDKWAKYTADFYSRGLFRTKNVPKKFLGKKVGDFDGSLDSTRSGVIYLSETVSKIKFQKKPKKFKEHIIASKVSGKDNGISLNQAKDVNYNIYENQLVIGETSLFSPISAYAFGYYKYQLEGTFYHKNGKLINKIKIIPRRENDRVFKGYIYIVEDDWQVYGADLTVTGTQIGTPIIDVLKIKQNYNYDKKSDSWALILQTIDFEAGMLGFNVSGRFSASYSNYNFTPKFTKKSFDKTVLSFEKNATKKDSVYWNNLRSVPLTMEERKDYKVKDSIKVLRKSTKYLDSIDAKQNKFGWLSPITGYTYKNSAKKWTFNYAGIVKNIDYNTVQGVAPTFIFNYLQRENDIGKRWGGGTNINYGFSDKKLRPVLYFFKQWDNFEKPYLRFSIGNKITQFDNRNPITKLENAIYTLIEKKNYAKYYEKYFAKISFSKEFFRGVRLFSDVEYAHRRPLYNTTDYSFFRKERTFFTNNPMDRTDAGSAFSSHKIITVNVYGSFEFGSKYMEYPDARFSISNHKYPKLFVGYRKTISSSNSNFYSDFIWTRLQQEIPLGNIGKFKYNARAGKFLKKEFIPFMDYYHPLGNETIFTPKTRTSNFYLLPYYQLSTNDMYAELHGEQNFEGFILGKIPLLNKLNFHTVVSAKSYFSTDNKPYTEFSIGLDNIGWGKWRFLRIDYVKSIYGNSTTDGFVFGVSL